MKVHVLILNNKFTKKCYIILYLYYLLIKNINTSYKYNSDKTFISI